MKKIFAFAILAVFLASSTLSADVLDFDDVDVSGGAQAFATYGGFDLLDFGIINKNQNPGTGYEFGNSSPENSAFNPFAQPMQMSLTSGSLWNFESATFAGAWRNDLQILVVGFLNNNVTDTKFFSVDSTGPTLFNFDFNGIDTLLITSFGGVDAGYGGSPGDQHFVMDDFTFQIVPEPTSFGIAALFGLGLLARRKR